MDVQFFKCLKIIMIVENKYQYFNLGIYNSALRKNVNYVKIIGPCAYQTLFNVSLLPITLDKNLYKKYLGKEHKKSLAKLKKIQLIF